jgi:hypothetical protein
MSDGIAGHQAEMQDIVSEESRHRAAKVYRFGANPGATRKERDRTAKLGPHSGLGT